MLESPFGLLHLPAFEGNTSDNSHGSTPQEKVVGFETPAWEASLRHLGGTHEPSNPPTPEAPPQRSRPASPPPAGLSCSQPVAMAMPRPSSLAGALHHLSSTCPKLTVRTAKAEHGHHTHHGHHRGPRTPPQQQHRSPTSARAAALAALTAQQPPAEQLLGTRRSSSAVLLPSLASKVFPHSASMALDIPTLQRSSTYPGDLDEEIVAAALEAPEKIMSCLNLNSMAATPFSSTSTLFSSGTPPTPAALRGPPAHASQPDGQEAGCDSYSLRERRTMRRRASWQGPEPAALFNQLFETQAEATTVNAQVLCLKEALVQEREKVELLERLLERVTQERDDLQRGLSARGRGGGQCWTPRQTSPARLRLDSPRSPRSARSAQGAGAGTGGDISLAATAAAGAAARARTLAGAGGARCEEKEERELLYGGRGLWQLPEVSCEGEIEGDMWPPPAPALESLPAGDFSPFPDALSNCY